MAGEAEHMLEALETANDLGYAALTGALVRRTGFGPVRDEVPLAFERFAHPNTFWLNPPEFLNAFRDLTGDTSMTEAAFTKRDERYPGFINGQLNAIGQMVITVRGDPRRMQIDGSDQVLMGDTTQLVLDIDDWHQFLAHAAQLRPVDQQPVSEHIPTNAPGVDRSGRA